MSKETVQRANEFVKGLAKARLEGFTGQAPGAVEAFDADGAFAEASKAAAEVVDAVSGNKEWEELAGVLKNHEAVRSVVNAAAFKEALLDRRRKFLAGANVALAIQAKDGLADIVIRSHA